MCKRNSPDKERERQKQKQKQNKKRKTNNQKTGYVRETPPIKNKPARDV